MKRVFWDIALLFSVLYGDWWLTCALALVGLVLFSFPVELLLAGFWIDLVYGAGRAGYAAYFPVTIGATVAASSAYVIRTSLFRRGTFYEKNRRFRN